VSIKIGSRVFAPRLLMTLLTLVVLAGLVALGRWQLRRADEKRVLYDAFAAGNDATQTIVLATSPVPRYSQLEAHGHYDESRQVLIDNMVSADGRAGYYAITPFALDGGGWILVNRGWVPVGASRALVPKIPVNADERPIRGRADKLPAPGIQLSGRAPLGPPFPVVASFPDHADIARLLNEAAWSGAAEVILLNAQEPDGYVRNWSPPGFPPPRHIGYAVQWFALAAALVVIYFVTNTRKVAANP
jgi:surfeit locus 1 family protein